MKVECEDALKRLGYNVGLKHTNNKSEKTKTWKQNIIWFNPPLSKSVSESVANTFLQLVAKHFQRHQKFHKIFDSSTVEVSYSYMNNMSKIIKGHKKVTSKTHVKTPKWNCRKKEECPMGANFQVNDVIHKCNVARPLPKKVYFRLAEGEWKIRFYNHKLPFKPKKCSNKTNRSSYLWHLKSVS